MSAPNLPPDAAESLSALARALEGWLREHPRWRPVVHDVARVVAALSAPEAATATGGECTPASGAPDAAADAPGGPDGPARPEEITPAAEPAPTEPAVLGRLRLGGATPNESVGSVLDGLRSRGAAPARAVEVHAELPDLDRLAGSARVKAEACRWAVHKRARLAAGADFFQELRAGEDALKERIRAYTPTSYIPVLQREGPRASDDELLMVAACLENLAGAAELCAAAGRGELRHAMGLLAEAQSALRGAVVAACLEYEDRDQTDAYRWLDAESRERGIALERHMTSADAADPAAHADLAARLARAREHAETRRAAERQRGALLRRAAYASRQITGGAVDPEHQWRVFGEAVEELLAGGMDANDAALRRLVEETAAGAPEGLELPAAARRVLAAREEASNEEEADAPARAPSATLLEARERLAGRVALLIGGEEHELARAERERALGLGELRWASKRPHASSAPFESDIARPEVAVVFFLAKLSNKHDGPDVRRMCRKHGKPCVMLTGGYGAEQMAQQYLLQASPGPVGGGLSA